MVDYNVNIKVSVDSKGAAKELNPLEKTSQKLGTSFEKFRSSISNVFKSTGKVLNSMGNIFRSVQQGLMQMGLSFLFAGLFIKGILENVLRSATNTFTTIMESSGFLGSNIQQLSAWWTFLKFTIGSVINEALGPLMPAIINIISQMIYWIRAHPKLIFWILVLGIAIAILMMLVGQLALFLLGLLPIFTLLASVIRFIASLFNFLWAVVKFVGLMIWGLLSTLFTSLGVGIAKWLGVPFKGFANLLWTVVGSAITGIAGLLGVSTFTAALIVGGILLALVAMFVTNFGNIREFIGEVFKTIFKIMLRVGIDILGIMADIWDFIVAIFTGDWDKMREALVDIAKRLIRIVMNLSFGIVNLIHNALIFIANFTKDILLVTVAGLWIGFQKDMLTKTRDWGNYLIDLFVKVGQGIVDGMLWPINKLIDALNSLSAKVRAKLGIPSMKRISVDLSGMGDSGKKVFNAVADAGIAVFDKLEQGSKALAKKLTIPYESLEQTIKKSPLSKLFEFFGGDLNNFLDNTDEAKKAIVGVGSSIKDSVTSKFSGMLGKVTGFIDEMKGAYKEGGIKGVLDAVQGKGGVLGSIGNFLGGVGDKLSGLKNLLPNMGPGGATAETGAGYPLGGLFNQNNPLGAPFPEYLDTGAPTVGATGATTVAGGTEGGGGGTTVNNFNSTFNAASSAEMYKQWDAKMTLDLLSKVGGTVLNANRGGL